MATLTVGVFCQLKQNKHHQVLWCKRGSKATNSLRKQGEGYDFSHVYHSRMGYGRARNLPILDPCHRDPNLCTSLNRSQGKEVCLNIRHVEESENENDEVEEDMLKTRTSFKRSKKNCSEVERESERYTTADQSLRERGRA